MGKLDQKYFIENFQTSSFVQGSGPSICMYTLGGLAKSKDLFRRADISGTSRRRRDGVAGVVYPSGSSHVIASNGIDMS